MQIEHILTLRLFCFHFENYTTDRSGVMAPVVLTKDGKCSELCREATESLRWNFVKQFIFTPKPAINHLQFLSLA